MPVIGQAGRISFGFVLSVIASYGQPANQNPTQKPDILICKDGERLVGHLVSSTGSSVLFKSDAAGQVTIEWSKIQELQSSNNFAVLPKGVKLDGAQDAMRVPQGTVSATDQNIQVSSSPQAAPQTVPITNVAELVDQKAFQSAFRRQNFYQGWIGSATVGIAYTNSTQRSQSYTSAAAFTRAVPGETWLTQRTRTLVGFNQAYGEITQPGTPTTKTSILHFGLEQDWYLKPRLFAFGQALFDHNYSQGLDLQQDYGGGLGFVFYKTDNSELDGKASLDYISQRFAISSQNKNLIGSTFGESFVHKFAHGIVFTEIGQYIPAWNDTSAYSAVVNANLTFPVYHHFGATLGGIDNYLNSPPLGYKRNSFTLTFGATYTIP